MENSGATGGEVAVVIIGGGAAGIAAARRLREARVDALLIEARPRLGGRAWTVVAAGLPLDLGCGWLHSADRNPWTSIAEAQGRTIDKTPPPWSRPAAPLGVALFDGPAFARRCSAFAGASTRSPRARRTAPRRRFSNRTTAGTT